MIRHHHITCKLCYMQATLSLRWHEPPMKPPGWKAQENNSLCYHQGKNGLRSRDDDSLVFLPNRIFVSEFHLSAGDSKLLWHCYMSDRNHSCLHAVFSGHPGCWLWLVVPWQGLSGGTTVSGTMIAAHKAGIPVFVTGGIGGVHRGGENSKKINTFYFSLCHYCFI